MKRVIHHLTALIGAVLLLCGILPISVGAITANYCKVLGEQVRRFLLFDDIGYKLDTPKGMMAFVDNYIPNRDDYGVGKPGEWGEYSAYSYPADVFEKWAHTFFNVKTEELRKVTDNLIKYNSSTNTYDREQGGMGGPRLSWAIAGYVENKDKSYTVYMRGYEYDHEPFKTLDKFYEDYRKEYNKDYEGSKDDIFFFDGSYQGAEEYNKVEINFDGTYAKYLSRTVISSIPKNSGMVTPDTKVDTPTSKPPVTNPPTSKPTTSQNTKTPSSATTSKPASSSESTETSGTSTSPAPTESVSQPSLVDTDTHISITGNVPDNATLSVKPISENEDTYTTIKEKLPEQVSRFQSYDINLLDSENATIQPDGSVQISIPKPDGFGDNLAVYRTEADGSMTLLDSEVKDGHVVFTTEHFSLYTIAELADVPAVTPPSSGIPTGGIVAIVIGVLVLVGGGVTAGILLYRKKNEAPSDID